MGHQSDSFSKRPLSGNGCEILLQMKSTTVDRLEEFRRHSQQSISPAKEKKNMPSSPTISECDQDEVLFKQVSESRSRLRALEEQLKHFNLMQRQFFATVNEQESARLGKELEQTTLAINSGLSEAKRSLKAIDQKISKAAAMQVTVLGKKLLEILQSWESSQQDYKKRRQAQLHRQFRIINPEATQSQLEEAIQSDSPTTFKQLFSPSMRAQAELRHAELRDRHEEMQKLEQNLTELHRMFQDVALMVEYQGEKIKSLQSYVSETEEYVLKSAIQTEKLVESKRKQQRCKLIVIAVVSVIVLITVAILVSEYWPKGETKEKPPIIIIQSPTPNKDGNPPTDNNPPANNNSPANNPPVDNPTIDQPPQKSDKPSPPDDQSTNSSDNNTTSTSTNDPPPPKPLPPVVIVPP